MLFQIMVSLLPVFISEAYADSCGAGETGYQSCGGKCTVCQNTTTKDVRIFKNAAVGADEEVVMPSGMWNGYAEAKNITIGEGITGSQDWAFGYSTAVGGEGTTLKLPSTFKSSLPFDSSDTENPYNFYYTNSVPFWNPHFETIDASALKDTELYIKTDFNQKIILDPNSNVNISLFTAYGNNGVPSITVECKGTDLNACGNLIHKMGYGWASGFLNAEVNAEYYKEYNEKGKISSEWTANGQRNYTYAANGDYSVYDENGKFLGNFMSNGKTRRIYSVEEAVLVTNGNGKNKFVIKYR